MFRIQNWKQALGLMALGSVFTFVGMLLSPVTAQRDKYGEIECTKLTIVDSKGNERVLLTNEGFIKIENENGTVSSIRGGDIRTYYLTIEQNGMPIARLGRDDKNFVAGKFTINNTLGDELVRIGPSQYSYNAGHITIHEHGMSTDRREAKTLDFDAGNRLNQITMTKKNTPNQPIVSLSIQEFGTSKTGIVQADEFRKNR